ncbi:hypothetical protein T4B_14091 [Trichinella pseudospiralis]|uniref:Uncharacterized protein n=1 Tax=Trichinella pseudospiralis TaxID=6337 RepID=A0A0V1I9I7_TRIPS|nr:hypothetical protein T4B_14091 [Trichinella pseudospiralis]
MHQANLFNAVLWLHARVQLQFRSSIPFLNEFHLILCCSVNTYIIKSDEEHKHKQKKQKFT